MKSSNGMDINTHRRNGSISARWMDGYDEKACLPQNGVSNKTNAERRRGKREEEGPIERYRARDEGNNISSER